LWWRIADHLNDYTVETFQTLRTAIGGHPLVAETLARLPQAGLLRDDAEMMGRILAQAF